jgi:hypothetical protein
MPMPTRALCTYWRSPGCMWAWYSLS